jgi:hypothetical protein
VQTDQQLYAFQLLLEPLPFDEFAEIDAAAHPTRRQFLDAGGIAIFDIDRIAYRGPDGTSVAIHVVPRS